ncbi:hypothetical protein DICVIV_02261 [Dictyocaulus viviparus]|uniref:Epoxide hydrolase n=1 Tax=Dictyocaulus viviparus TaxID=29172 RepID=A0A0D8Y6A0_DICVI|nr:hypothetical protein DICVIV_02261 [Dictyocaulus viviparus]
MVGLSSRKKLVIYFIVVYHAQQNVSAYFIIGFSQVACARVFRKLMDRLKFEKFYLQGGDWGAVVTSHMAKLYPTRVLGIHLNMMPIPPFSSSITTALDIIGTIFPKLVFSSEDHHNHNVFEKIFTMIVESGYMHIQGTKPDTVGTALNDSPIGLAAYILEKFSTWTNLENRDHKDGGLTKKFSRDELLTIVMIYWLNGNIVSSQRFYREFFLDQRNKALQKKFSRDELLTIVMIYWLNGNIVSSQRFYREFFLDQRNKALQKVYMAVPTAHAFGLNDYFDRTPPEISSVMCNLTRYTAIADMGHFGALEMPHLLASDIFHFVTSLQK